MTQYVLSAPNFSEGRRSEVIEAVVGQLRNRPGVKLLDYHADPDFNRTMVTVIGKPAELKDALIAMAAKSIELIDMEQHSGAHPRIGAQDTLPIFPLRNITLGECIELAEQIGKEAYEKLGVPVYFAGENARTPERRNLDYIRKGHYEGLKKVAHTEARRPDIGPAALHPTAGAVIVSAGERNLVAFNVILDTPDLEIAKRIAKIVRGPSGGFTTVRSIGLKFEERGKVVVSMNMFDYDRTPLYRTFETIKMEAARYGVGVVGSEVLGIIPLESLVNVAEYYLRIENFDRDQIQEYHLMDLEDGGATPVEEHAAFLDKLASSAPAPGGGSAAAYSGAMSAALVAMVARLTIGRASYADVEGRMYELASQAERLRAFFSDAVVQDDLAFQGLMAARKLPKANEAEQAARLKAIEAATAQAAAVPLSVAENALKVIGMAREAAETGNKNAITDAGSAALLAWAALQGAGLNVKINAAGASDQAAAQGWLRAIADVSREGEALVEKVRAVLKERADLDL